MEISISRLQNDEISSLSRQKSSGLGFQSRLARNGRSWPPPRRRPSNHYYEERKHTKIMGLDECIESRPPIRFDLSGPTPCTYSPPADKAPMKRSTPAYTMGKKPASKGARGENQQSFEEFLALEGGGRRAWSTEYFANDDVWTRKCDYESAWPGPNSYNMPEVLGHYVIVGTQHPAFSIQKRRPFSIVKPGSEKEPSPNTYRRECSQEYAARRPAAWTFCGGTIPASRHLWTMTTLTRDKPGPGDYDPYMHLSKKRAPAFSFGRDARM
ncbi:protein STPG3-like isoform X1 [Oscarella lobularis]|uniref:protein STPG3-like isoform X1 n=1 Tax=Oscarella lobularis TaxID=121494 RepID=UPI003313197D